MELFSYGFVFSEPPQILHRHKWLTKYHRHNPIIILEIEIIVVIDLAFEVSKCYVSSLSQIGRRVHSAAGSAFSRRVVAALVAKHAAAEGCYIFALPTSLSRLSLTLTFILRSLGRYHKDIFRAIAESSMRPRSRRHCDEDATDGSASIKMTVSPQLYDIYNL